MVDANDLKQLEDVLIAYQENQETLTPVVTLAEKIFGENWMSELTEALSASSLDSETKKTLQDKADHAIHYYGALAAWEEASGYLEHKTPFDKALLEERLPVLEYWLALFGSEGATLVEQVRNLIANGNTETEVRSEATETTDNYVENSNDKQSVEEVSFKTESVEEAKQENVLPETPVVEQVALGDTQSVEISVPEVKNDEDIASVEIVEKIQTNKEKTIDTADENSSVLESLPEVENVSQEAVPSNFSEITDKPVVEEKQVQESMQQEETTPVLPVDQETMQEPEEIPPQEIVWKSEQTDTNPVLEVEEEMTPVSVERVPEVEQKGVDLNYNVAPYSQNWEIGNFLRQKRLYDDANNWLDAWCIRMNNAEKTEYPFYGFIADLTYDLKEKLQNILENQLLEEVVDKDIEGGREALVRLAEALNAEIEGFPDDLKQSTPEKLKQLSARDILGNMDTSTEKEYIGAAPDGFELMDDPYAVSTEKIISEFEKTEQKAQNEIDKLNIMDENSSEKVK